MKKIIILISALIVITIPIILFILYNNKIKIEDYSNDYCTFKYDTTWQLKEENNEITLTHKNKKATIKIKNKVLKNNLIDISLKELVNDIKNLINEQNPEYQLINFEENPNNKFDSYSFLYETDNEQALVNIYKKETNLVIVYYVSNTKYYDILLDSVDNILNSITIKNITE